MKGLSVPAMFLGLVLFIFCFAIALAVPDIFNLADNVEEIIRLGFLALGVFAISIGVVKGGNHG